MGDHRASIKLSFSMHGIEKEAEMYINYYTDSNYGCDQRIIDFFTACHEEAMDKWEEIVWKSQEKERKLAQENYDRNEYERLKKKYE